MTNKYHQKNKERFRKEAKGEKRDQERFQNFPEEQNEKKP